MGISEGCIFEVHLFSCITMFSSGEKSISDAVFFVVN